MARTDIELKPNSMANIFSTLFDGSASSLGIISIVATYRNVPDARALSAAGANPDETDDTPYPA